MTDQAQDARSVAYASLVLALVGVRTDPATARFDAELAAAEAAGGVDPAVARTLRWWQRQALRGVEDHLAGVLPTVLASLSAADREALATVASSAAAWAAATEAAGGPPLPPDRAPLPRPSAAPTRPPGSDTSGPPRPSADPGGAPYLRPVDVDGPPPRTVGPLRPGFAPSDPWQPPRPPSPASTIRPDDPVAHDSAGSGAPSRRLLVAGLTVLADDDRTRRGASVPGATHDQRTTTRHDDVPGASG